MFALSGIYSPVGEVHQMSRQQNQTRAATCRLFGSVIALLFALSIELSCSSAGMQQTRWQNVCPDESISYCQDVGKEAYDATGPPVLRNTKLGKVIGVSWRPKGSIIGISPAIPETGIPKEIRTAPRDAYYYIVDDGWGPEKAFLRECREIRVADPAPWN
jgi:hypothetical protein